MIVNLQHFSYGFLILVDFLSSDYYLLNILLRYSGLPTLMKRSR